MNKFQLLDLKTINNGKTILTPLELKDYIDFEVKRVYFFEPLRDIDGHCHKEEKELFILQKGSCKAVIDQGNGKEEIPMEGGKHAIYVANYVWHGFKDIAKDSLILALSSTNYSPDRSDYIEDYNEYLTIRDEKLNG
jgi:hypothetical protein